jgi:hypothetical protein
MMPAQVVDFHARLLAFVFARLPDSCVFARPQSDSNNLGLDVVSAWCNAHCTQHDWR